MRILHQKTETAVREMMQNASFLGIIRYSLGGRLNCNALYVTNKGNIVSISRLNDTVEKARNVAAI